MRLHSAGVSWLGRHHKKAMDSPRGICDRFQTLAEADGNSLGIQCSEACDVSLMAKRM